LAVITAARLRLVPAQTERVVALVGLADTAAGLDALAAIRRHADGLEAAEIFFRDGLDLVCRHGGLPRPLPGDWPAYLVVECAGRHDPSETLFEALSTLDLADDATAVAADGPGRARLWAYRERHTEAIASLGVPHKLDVTLPLDRLAAFVPDVRSTVDAVAPDATLVLFGHVGDGNLHVNVIGPAPDDDRVDDEVLRLVLSYGGSISAEHGIGRAKAAWMPFARTRSELSVMAAVKAAWDPHGLLNPGVLLGPA
ncbi:MAG: FAD-binding oxidoreductase, partial [Actinomycetes bacterium]